LLINYWEAVCNKEFCGGMVVLTDRLIQLHLLPLGQTARVETLNVQGMKRRRMLDLGLVPNTTVEAIQRSPSGDPKAYYIRGAVIALRSEEASQIIVDTLT